MENREQEIGNGKPRRMAGFLFAVLGSRFSRPSSWVPVLLLAFLLCSACIARYIRLEEKGLTCVEALRVAVDAVRRMNYSITEYTKATPGSPGMIVASRQEGTRKQGLVVRVYCTTQGSEVEAETDQGGIAQLSVTNEFRRSFEVAAANRPPPRPAPEHGVDVLMTLERDAANLGADLSALSVLPVAVRITNHTPRVYRFRVAGVMLQTASGERVPPLALKDVTAQLSADAAQTVRQKVLTDRTVEANEELSGFLLFPFKSYVRARVELTDRASDETEGFSIEF